MKQECFDEGAIQAFIDGELSQQKVERFSRHIAFCDGCARALATAEHELASAFTAIGREFDTLVPTRRLWDKINNSIEEDHVRWSLPEKLFAFLTNPAVVGFASLLIVFGLFIGLYGLRTNNSIYTPVEVDGTNATQTQPTDIRSDSALASEEPNMRLAREPSESNEIPRISAVKSDFRKNATIRERIGAPVERTVALPAEQPASAQLLGEESYIKTIETLERSVDGRKDAALGTSSRFALARDMALATATIDRLKDEVQRDPKNQTARELLRTTYQNKISLLNSVAEKSELMASLR